jgi:hypothetical protein
MIRAAIVHPSFGRPQQAYDMACEWMQATDNPEEVEYLIGLDDNDPTVELYQLLFGAGTGGFGRFEISVGGSRNAVEAINRLGTLLSSTTELIVCHADDQAPCAHWDTELFNVLAGVDNFNDVRFIGVDDGLQPYGAFLNLTVNRAWHTRFGYLLYPEYNGVFADDDMRGIAQQLNAIIHAPHLVFQHRHYTLGVTPMDATYDRINDPAACARNEDIYMARRSRNFDV